MNNLNKTSSRKSAAVSVAAGVAAIIAAIIIAALVIGGAVKRSVKKPKTPPNTSPAGNVETTAAPELLKERYADLRTPADGSITKTPLKFSNESAEAFKETLFGTDIAFKYGEYFAVDEAFATDWGSPDTYLRDVSVLKNGKIDAGLLFEKVKINNKAYFERKDINIFSKEADDETVKAICEVIADTANGNPDLYDAQRLASTLSNLVICYNTTALSSAAVSADLVFSVSPTALKLFKSRNELTERADEEETEKSLFIHETMHLLQFSASYYQRPQGVESAAFCRIKKADALPNCMWISWLLEAAAEKETSEYTGIEPLTYTNYINYLNDFTLNYIINGNYGSDMFKKFTFMSSFDDVFAALGITDTEAKKDFVKLLYAVEVADKDSDDFFEYMQAQTGTELTENQKSEICKQCREDALMILTRNYYSGIQKRLASGSLDKESLFFMMRLFELETLLHTSYSDKTEIPYARRLLVYQSAAENKLFELLAADNGTTAEALKEEYSNYKMLINTPSGVKPNAGLDSFAPEQKEFITEMFEKMNKARFVKLADMADLLD